MRKSIPGVLWVGIVAFGLVACVQFAIALRRGPATLAISALLDAVLIIGLVHGQKWAYILTIVFSGLGAAVGMGKGMEVGLSVLIGNAVIVVPVIVCTSFFFPKPSSPPQDDGAIRGP